MLKPPTASSTADFDPLDLPAILLAQQMHTIWLDSFTKSHAVGTKRYKPVPDKSLQGWSRVRFCRSGENSAPQESVTPRQITYLMSADGNSRDVRRLHLFDCELVEKEGVSFIVQNIAQLPKWINPSLMHQLNGRLAKDYLEAALPVYRTQSPGPAINVRETLASKLHDIWVEANKDWAPQQQLVKYAELPDYEKEKDLVMADVVLAAAWEVGGLLDPDVDYHI